MDPARKRKVRLVVALSAAALLAGGLFVVTFSTFTGGTKAATPSQLLRSAAPGRSYEVTGKVVDGSVARAGDELRFRIRDRNGSAAVPVVYRGVVPDPFRAGREVIVSGMLRRGTFVGERDSLVTKCPSKFANQPPGRPS